MGAEAIIQEVLEREGWPAFTDDPHDRGGPTKGGITLARLRAWRGEPVTVADLMLLEEEEARAIYAEIYVTGPRFDEITDPLLRGHVVDCGVLHGTDRAARWLQSAIGGLTVDGRVGRLTLGALAMADPHRVGLELAGIRIRFLGRILSSNYRERAAGRTSRDQSRFAAGWLNRATHFLDLEARRRAVPIVSEVA